MNAEDQAKQAGIRLTTPEDLLQGYDTTTITTENGHGYVIESFVPGNLLIDIGSPVVKQFTDGIEEGEESVRSPINDQNVFEHIKNIVCKHVISVRFSQAPQHLCREGTVSIDRVEQEEVLEIYRQLRDFSFRDAETFQAAGTPDTDGSAGETESDENA